jgi:hypothetical protein
MRLPNKINSFSESSIAKFPVVLDVLEKGDMQVSALYAAVKKSTDDVGDFIEILDCLYALGKVEYLEKERVLHYAD